MQPSSLRPDCLVVLDTLGTRNTAAILGVTALRFDLDSQAVEPEEISLIIDPNSNRDEGRTFDAGALSYWADRPNMHDVFTREGGLLLDALADFDAFYQGCDMLWTTGAGFESAVLGDAFEHFKMLPPWAHWQVACMRTIGHVASWLDGTQLQPTAEGIDTSETAHLRLDALRAAFATLKTKETFKDSVRHYAHGR